MRKYSNNNNNKDMSPTDMKEYSWRKYRIEPYLATVCLRATHALDHLAAGANSMTGYGFLPDFTESVRRPIQNYREQVVKRIEEWGTIQEQIDKPYIPPVVVGWNASPCGSIPEGAALLSKILPDGSVDNSYSAKIRELRDEYGF